MSNLFGSYSDYDESVRLKEREYSRILSAAVVNKKFRNLLLANPGLAIQKGFGGEAFHLEKDETERINAIKVTNLEEFARLMNPYRSYCASHA